MTPTNSRKALFAIVTAVVLIAGSAGSAEAEVVSRDTITTSFLFLVSCANGGAGDLVSGETTLTQMVTQTIDQGGGTHVVVHFDQHGSGVGAFTGDKYSLSAVFNFSFNFRPGDGPSSQSFTQSSKVVGPGKGNNFKFTQTVHMTVNANGEVTSEVVNESLGCK